MLKVKDLSYSYGKVRALQNICLKIEDEKITGIMGSNGAGKSTLLYILAGILQPSEGRIYLDGKDITHYPPFRRVEEGISLVPEGKHLFSTMTVKENLESGAYGRNARKKMEDTLEWVYQIFPIFKEREKQQASTLSGGEQQMLAIARGIMSKPSILLLDEPLLGLAPTIISHVIKILKEINEEGVTVVIAEQNLRITLQISDRGYVLENGRNILEGSAESLKRTDRVKKVYLGL